ncbi:unnamed protein product [marine sediment metagenome]|uniref:Uncharacterized protein n=1 Tax=marine sediment metagenome TaxID=412755 RepID=X0SFZ4_9ZZZZ
MPFKSKKDRYSGYSNINLNSSYYENYLLKSFLYYNIFKGLK